MSDLKSILKPEICANCKICCVFKAKSLVYVPKEVKVKEQENGMFTCVHRCENTGCTLGQSKPVECAAWPFSVSKRGNELLLVLERSCPELNKKERLDEVKKFALEFIAPDLLEYSRKHLHTLREYDGKNAHFLICAI